MKDIGDIAPGRLGTEELARNFGDAHPPLDHRQAAIAANRCYFCHDAPCVQACPTGIDIPSFIRKIQTGNLKGSAHDILSANIMGAMCARVCPTEVLCEQACVRNTQEHMPVSIGALQRHATDALFASGAQLFTRGDCTGRTVAVVGAGPAGLSCAHRLARHGHRIVVFDARDKAGGLNEYGIAAYKVPNDIAQREVEYILEIGGIEMRHGQILGRDVELADLRRDYDAVFLGLGLGAVNALGADGENLVGVANAVDYIDALRQAADLAALPVGRRVVVIGGGNTAIDVATQSRRLGADDVTIVYRRGPVQMSATWVEQEWAQTNGVHIKHWARPVRVEGTDGRATGVTFEYTQLDDNGRLAGTGDTFTLAADTVFKAIGQVFVPAALNGAVDVLELDGGRLAVNADRQTSLEDVWAGGDCVAGGDDLTVVAVEDGKLAADAIDRRLRN